MRNPGRLWEVNKEVEDMGAKVISQYALLGEWDFVNILEAPNNTVVARVASSLGSRGHFGTYDRRRHHHRGPG